MTMTRLRHGLDAFFIGIAYSCIKALPLAWTRGFFAALARGIGPFLKVSNVARDNLRHAFPEKTEAEIESILKSCWDNLGRVVGEFPHVSEILKDKSRFKIEGTKVLDELAQQDKSAIFFTGHMGNWEIAYAPLLYHNLPVNLIARHHNNPFIENLLMRDRSQHAVTLVSRSRAGSRKLLNAIKNNELIGAIVDQYASDGIFLPFFNRPARTTLGLARLAAKHNLKFIPVQVLRRGEGSDFTVIFHDPIPIDLKKTPQENSEAMMIEANNLLTTWITEYPAQWLWLHKRWKVKGHKDLK